MNSPGTYQEEGFPVKYLVWRTFIFLVLGGLQFQTSCLMFLVQPGSYCLLQELLGFHQEVNFQTNEMNHGLQKSQKNVSYLKPGRQIHWEPGNKISFWCWLMVALLTRIFDSFMCSPFVFNETSFCSCLIVDMLARIFDSFNYCPYMVSKMPIWCSLMFVLLTRLFDSFMYCSFVL